MIQTRNRGRLPDLCVPPRDMLDPRIRRGDQDRHRLLSALQKWAGSISRFAIWQSKIAMANRQPRGSVAIATAGLLCRIEGRGNA